jgi:UDP-N-acetylglucosamine/UDP-N-acetylgalactosamine diphosphorylase
VRAPDNVQSLTTGGGALTLAAGRWKERVPMPVDDTRYQEYARKLTRFGQTHLLAFWSELTSDQREQLLADLDQIDWDRCVPLIHSHVRRRPTTPVQRSLDPPSAFSAAPGPDQADLYARARRAGAEAIRAGRVAAFMVAGGQGTRLGFDGPKGAFPISPLRNASLFQLFAESLLGAERRYGRRPRWYIMTSLANHAETTDFFARYRFFGLSPDDVVFFQQGQMPAFLPGGRIALAERHRVALSPDGHGGSLRALAEHGALADMRSRGIDTISYFQVDNPLVYTLDPLFVGLHLLTGSEMSSKAVHKASDDEKVGVFCLMGTPLPPREGAGNQFPLPFREGAGGGSESEKNPHPALPPQGGEAAPAPRLGVIEYSDLPAELARAKDPDGSRRFDAGSIAVHILSREFVERLTAPGAVVQLPWHRADKKVPVVDERGEPVTPTAPNVVKLEMFVFDAIPLARNPLVLYTSREEEFSPVKNAIGADSPTTTRRDLIRRAANWLETCGVTVPRGADGEPAAVLEIRPVFALDAGDLRGQLKAPPVIQPGARLLL